MCGHGQWIMTKIVTLAHRVWMNKKLKDIVKSKLTFAPSLDINNTSLNKQHTVACSCWCGVTSTVRDNVSRRPCLQVGHSWSQ